ncbi:MAG: prepilin-type N-terminal cleavage/methylation domain-containing protein [Acholeplasmatales bacterium]|nr:prepilin-type N-terminal cleavage/methylation domain-containing protein [Acholeplasmatales bacterium]
MTKQLNKKGTSLVELIAVIVIMGIIAGIAIPTTIAVINRQKKNAAKSSADNVMAAAESVLMECAAKSTTQWPTYVTTTTAANGVCQVLVKDLATYGELKSNPVETSSTNKNENETVYIYIDTTNKCHWSTDTIYINGVELNVDGTSSTPEGGEGEGD